MNKKMKIISRERAKDYLMALAYKFNKEDQSNMNVEEVAEEFLKLADEDEVFGVDEHGYVYIGTYEDEDE